MSALAVAGVHVTVMPARTPFLEGRSLRWSRSAVLAAERSCGYESGDALLRMLLGIVNAEAGATPRLLRELNVTPREVARMVAEQELGFPGALP
ncbi:MAG: hypothetical protein ACT4OM_11390 [Actinomycetota bacterium]